MDRKVQETTEVSAVSKKSSVGIVFALMAGYSMVYMDKSMVSTAIIPISQQFNLDSGQTGLIMSFFFLGYSLMQIPGGWLADKIGAKKVLMLSLAIISFFSFAFGMVSGLMLFMMIRFFAGVGHGGYPPSVSKAVANNFPQERRTFIQSMILSTSGIGGILAFTLGANLISQSWRLGYIVLGSLFAAAFILVGIFVPKDLQLSKKEQAAKIPFKEVIANRNVLTLFVAMLLLNFLLYGNISWLPTVLAQKFSLEITQVGYLLAVNAIFQTIATMFAGVLLSKLFLGKEKIFILGATIISAIFVVVFVLSSNLIVAMVALILLSMISVSAFTAIFTLPHKIMDGSIIGSAIGIINTGGTLGGFLAPMILGQLINLGGGSFTIPFGFMALASILCGLTVLTLKDRSQD
ncbi:MFS transporter [Candidatus Enterococcus ferrettii]|uniref:Major facilitator superfamily (MFS) profile domain-containing protein n=1 Tax=Candidatus Enterococcus ferrettii TaxID=2815324 RepID=A0ABV0EMX2_9ENTE|nr:MFS transporter [Enterococcus sp. 665A]